MLVTVSVPFFSRYTCSFLFFLFSFFFIIIFCSLFARQPYVYIYSASRFFSHLRADCYVTRRARARTRFEELYIFQALDVGTMTKNEAGRDTIIWPREKRSSAYDARALRNKSCFGPAKTVLTLTANNRAKYTREESHPRGHALTNMTNRITSRTENDVWFASMNIVFNRTCSVYNYPRRFERYKLVPICSLSLSQPVHLRAQ